MSEEGYLEPAASSARTGCGFFFAVFAGLAAAGSYVFAIGVIDGMGDGGPHSYGLDSLFAWFFEIVL